MPIYKVKFDGKMRLVKAATSAGARNHVIKPLVVDVSAVDAEEALILAAEGVKLETAGEDTPPSEPSGDGDSES